MSEMTKEEATLWARGADSVGGELMLRNKVMATYRNGVFALTDAGVAELEVEEVEAVEVKAKPAAKSPKAPKPPKTPEVGGATDGLDLDENPLD